VKNLHVALGDSVFDVIVPDERSPKTFIFKSEFIIKRKKPFQSDSLFVCTLHTSQGTKYHAHHSRLPYVSAIPMQPANASILENLIFPPFDIAFIPENVPSFS
jgi:hypothetical protein